MTLYELLALRRPFEAQTVQALRQQVLEARAPRLGALVPGLSRDVEAVVAVAMAPELARRYASAADFARDLTRLLERRPVEARAAGPWLQLARWTERHRGAAAALALGLFDRHRGPAGLRIPADAPLGAHRGATPAGRRRAPARR